MSDADPTKVLIVDDIPANLKMLREALESEGYEILGATSGEAALRIAQRAQPDIVLLDIVMPGMDGYTVCHKLKQDPTTEPIPVIFITVRDENLSLVEGFRVGGVDYITKPFEKEELLVRVRNHLKISRLTRQLVEANRALQQEIDRREEAEEARQKADDQLSMLSEQDASRWGIDGFIGQSHTIRQILEDVQKLQSARQTSVLITGESGTGKELIARAIHFGGARSDSPFIPVNCSAIPAELAESYFFGHVRGAFSGAHAARKGCFELADGGTLFLDEIGDMPIELQPKLLRVIEDACVVPVGGSQEKQIDTRVVAATNQHLEQQIREGGFREDLYYRLARFAVAVPPLRDRKEDLPLLANHFLGLFAEEMGLSQPMLSPESLAVLGEYGFPGNIRELKNIMERALIQGSGTKVITPAHLQFIKTSPSIPRDARPEESKPLDMDRIEETVILRAQKDDSQVTDESRILDYLREHGSISNAECREFLAVDRHRATYLLQKMHRYGLLERDGELRWTRYRLR